MTRRTAFNRHMRAASAIVVSSVLMASAALAQDSAALQSLKALSENEEAAVAPELSSIGWMDATYLVDGLSLNELLRLRKKVDSYAVSLPPNIEGAIRAKTPNAGTSRKNR